MDNSTLTKAPPKSKVRKENENIMQHIVDMNERITYLMDALKNQAEMVQRDHDVLERVRNRMGM